MTEKDFKKIQAYSQCPFTRKLVIKEYKKLVEVAEIKKSSEIKYELHEKNSDGDSKLINNIKFEQLVFADKKAYEGNFVKLFRYDFISSLNTYALKIFVYILENLQTNDNRLKIRIYDLSIKTHIDEPRKIYDGLNELIQKEVIAKQNTEEQYYVNPLIMFKGVNRKILKNKENY